MRTPWIALAVGLLAGCGPSSEEIASARATAEQLRQDVEARSAALREAARSTPSGGTCDPSMADVGLTRVHNYVEVMEPDLGSLRTAGAHEIDQMVSDFLGYLDGGDVKEEVLQDYLERLAILRRRHVDSTYEIVLVGSRLRQPTTTGGNRFEPGRFVGRAFVWDAQSNRVVCATEVDASLGEYARVRQGSESFGLAFQLRSWARRLAFRRLGLGEPERQVLDRIRPEVSLNWTAGT